MEDNEEHQNLPIWIQPVIINSKLVHQTAQCTTSCQNLHNAMLTATSYEALYFNHSIDNLLDGLNVFKLFRQNLCMCPENGEYTLIMIFVKMLIEIFLKIKNHWLAGLEKKLLVDKWSLSTKHHVSIISINGIRKICTCTCRYRAFLGRS